jgi:hypothetical protein
MNFKKYYPVIVAVMALLVAGTGGCSKSPEEIKAEQVKHEAETTGRLVVKSNRTNTVIDAVRIAAAGEAPSVPRKGSVDGVAEQTFNTLPPGKYTITARAEGWPEVTQEATVTAAQTTEVAVTFKSGSLRLESLPVGATVKAGNAILGKTPLTVAQLPPGELKLTIEYPLWPVVPFKTTITEDKETVETVRLPHGRLVLESSPAGATVLFAGRPIGQTPLTIERFQAGAKKLTLQSKDFPPMEVAFTMEDQGEVKLSQILAMGFPEVEFTALLRTVWVDTPPADKEKLSPAFKPFSSYPSRNGIIKNLDRKKLFENWLGKVFRFSGTVKTYNPETGIIELTEPKSELSKCRVLVLLSAATRSDKDFIAQLAVKAAPVSLYARLDAMEEPEWPAKAITIEFSAAEPLR